MGSCSFVELRKLKFCAHYSKGDFKKACQILLGTVCRDGASSLSVCMAECCSLWGRDGSDRVDLGCVLWKRGVCSMPVLLGSSVRLSGSTRSWPGVEQPSPSPCGAAAQLGSIPSWAGGGWSKARAAWPRCLLTFGKLSWTSFTVNVCAGAVVWLGGTAGRQGVMFCI